MATVEIATEITGNVYTVEVREGDRVSEGDTLVVLESMKMEIPIVSSEDGTVKSVLVKEGEVVTEGNTVVVIEL